jgi:sodium-dependent dicarboxylate transporter 2/3/5
MGYALPTALVYFALMFAFFAWRRCPRTLPVSVDALRDEYASLGAISLAEAIVLIDLLVLVLLWMLRSFSVLPAAVGDGTVSIAAALALFLLPAHWPRPPCVPCGDFCSPAWHHKRHVKPVPRVLDWSDSKNVGWGVLLILGGGFALAAGMRKAGLTATVSLLLGALQNVHPLVLVLVVVTTITFMTELMSNVAVANLLLPVLGATAVAAHQNPLLLMAPATISCSFAFMLPVRDQLFILFCCGFVLIACQAATPPNAIICASGHVRTADMARVGLLANIVGIVLLTAGTFALGLPTLGITLGELPSWAMP